MSTRYKILVLVIYLIGLSTVIWGVTIEERNFMAVNIGALIMVIPWIICLKQTLKMKPQRLLWFYVLFFFGVLSIPIFLLSTTPKNRPTPSQNQA